MKYRKKPVVIEAVQYNPRVKEQLAEAVRFCPMLGIYAETDLGSIKTLEGIMTVEVGDWIIKGVQGEFYPCKPDIFSESYEAVE